MYCNDSISFRVRCMVSSLRRKSRVRPFREVTEIIPLLQDAGQKQAPTNGAIVAKNPAVYPSLDSIAENTNGHDGLVGDDSRAESPWSRSQDIGMCGYICRWPITTILWLTIPDCRKYPRLRMLTFAMCIVWIGCTSYQVAFLITIVGNCIASICIVDHV